MINFLLNNFYLPESDTKEMRMQIQRPLPNELRVYGLDVIRLTFVHLQRFATDDLAFVNTVHLLKSKELNTSSGRI